MHPFLLSLLWFLLDPQSSVIMMNATTNTTRDSMRRNYHGSGYLSLLNPDLQTPPPQKKKNKRYILVNNNTIFFLNQKSSHWLWKKWRPETTARGGARNLLPPPSVPALELGPGGGLFISTAKLDRIEGTDNQNTVAFPKFGQTLSSDISRITHLTKSL